jgi:hypothetical protein
MNLWTSTEICGQNEKSTLWLPLAAYCMISRDALMKEPFHFRGAFRRHMNGSWFSGSKNKIIFSYWPLLLE